MWRGGKGSGTTRWRGSCVDESITLSVFSGVGFGGEDEVVDLIEDVALLEGCGRASRGPVILTAANISRAKLSDIN